MGRESPPCGAAQGRPGAGARGEAGPALRGPWRGEAAGRCPPYAGTALVLLCLHRIAVPFRALCSRVRVSSHELPSCQTPRGAKCCRSVTACRGRRRLRSRSRSICWRV
ncbi:unnamed protein product [Coccothraustes coccothraustes]